MKNYFVFFSRRTILDFLRKYNKGPDSKDYELLIAMVLSRALEEMWGKPNVIGFEISEKYARDLPDLGSLTIKQVEKVLRRYVEENSPVDLAITKGTILNHEPKSAAFQLKRFGKNTKEKDTNALIEFLNKMPKKYSKVKATLVVILEPGVQILPLEVRKNLITDNYPFNRIMFIIGMNDKLMIGEFWPKFGMNEYNPEKLMNESNT